MFLSKKFAKFSTLTSLIVLSILGQALAIGEEDLAGYSDGNALRANPGLIVFDPDILEEKDPDKRRDKIQGIRTIPQSNLSTHFSAFLGVKDGFFFAVIKNALMTPSFPGLSWVYGMNPNVDWRAAFNENKRIIILKI